MNSIFKGDFLAITELIKNIVKSLGDKKGFDIVVLDLRGIAVFCDYFVICSALNIPHIEALLQQIKSEVFSEDVRSIEGTPSSGWILIDMGRIIIHLFLPDKREYYSLEELWGDAKKIGID